MSAEDSPVVAARRAQLKDWIDRRYGARHPQAEFLEDFRRMARAKGLKASLAQGELSGLLNGSKSFGEKKARSIEETMGMPENYLLLPSTMPRQGRHSITEELGVPAAAAAWMAYIRASTETVAAIDLLLLPARERQALSEVVPDGALAVHAAKLLERHASEVLKSRKTA